MKKTLMLILLFTNCIVLGCDKKSNKNDLEKENLKGNVVSVKRTNYKVTEKFGEPVKGEKECDDFFTICENIKKYNDLGNLIEISDYNSFGVLFISKIKYNDKNQRIEQNRYTPEEGKLVMQFKWKYDLNGNCIEESSDHGWMVKREYDANNNLNKELIKHWQTGEYIETTYIYNENNEIITEIYSQGKAEYTYYDDGNIKDIIRYTKDGRIKTKWSYKYEYDSHKNWIVQIEYENGTPTSYIERIIEYKN